MKIIATRFSIPGLLPVTGYSMQDEERLAHKFSMFDSITKPTVMSQTDENFQWHIFAGEFLKNKILCDDSRMIVHYVTAKEFKVRCSQICDGITTVRVDDDDGISPNLLERLDQYSYGIISFPKGRMFKVIDGDLIFSDEPSYLPCVSAGLSRINGDIYECGNHATVNKRYSVIYDDLDDAYFFCCSNFCWSGRTSFYSSYADRNR